MKTAQFLLLLFIIGKPNICLSQDLLVKEGLIADAESYRKTISSEHKNPFTKISKEQFNQKINNLIAAVPGLNRENFIVELFKINAFIEDEHTFLLPDYEMELPFKFELFDEGMTIVAADSVNQQYLLHRILSINNNSWSTIDSLYKTIIKRDNQSYFKFFEAYYFNNPGLLLGLGIINGSAAIPFKLLSPSGDTTYTTINSHFKAQNISWKYANQFKNILAYSKNSNYWYKYDDKSKTLYFNYMRCREDIKEPFTAFNQKLFQTIADLNPAKLVLDLRFNSGGNSAVLKPFIDSIKRSGLNTNERFFVLIGRKVMSSSLMNVIELKNATNARFVGELTGGNINHFGELKTFELPNSKIRVNYSTKYWENWKNHDGAFKPDIETSYTLSDFLKSYDKALEIIFQK